MVVKYCFCLYWLWIAPYRNKWIYLKIHILRLSLFHILLTFFNWNLNSQTHFHCSSSSIRFGTDPNSCPSKDEEIRPPSYKLNCLTKTFFSFTHFFFYCTLRPRQEAHTEQMTSCQATRPQKRPFRRTGNPRFQYFFPVFFLRSCDKEHRSKYHSAGNNEAICYTTILIHFCHFEL